MMQQKSFWAPRVNISKFTDMTLGVMVAASAYSLYQIFLWSATSERYPVSLPLRC